MNILRGKLLFIWQLAVQPKAVERSKIKHNVYLSLAETLFTFQYSPSESESETSISIRVRNLISKRNFPHQVFVYLTRNLHLQRLLLSSCASFFPISFVLLPVSRLMWDHLRLHHHKARLLHYSAYYRSETDFGVNDIVKLKQPARRIWLWKYVIFHFRYGIPKKRILKNWIGTPAFVPP